jgi:hypothetical protein
MLEPEKSGVLKNGKTEKRKNKKQRRCQRLRLKLKDIPKSRAGAAGVGCTASA